MSWQQVTWDINKDMGLRFYRTFTSDPLVACVHCYHSRHARLEGFSLFGRGIRSVTSGLMDSGAFNRSNFSLRFGLALDRHGFRKPTVSPPATDIGLGTFISLSLVSECGAARLATDGKYTTAHCHYIRSTELYRLLCGYFSSTGILRRDCFSNSWNSTTQSVSFQSIWTVMRTGVNKRLFRNYSLKCRLLMSACPHFVPRKKIHHLHLTIPDKQITKEPLRDGHFGGSHTEPSILLSDVDQIDR